MAETRERTERGEDLLLDLLEEPVAPGEPAAEALEAHRESGEVSEAEAGAVEAGEDKIKVFEYSVGPVTYIVSGEGYRVVEPSLDPEVARAVDAVAEYLARRGLPASRAAEAAEKLGLSQVVQRQLEAFTYHVE
ncbi:MAG TPA: hypothetical protein EYP33_01225, partial [Pyrodictium sp.]|nr:hypothetical protein [Pyrodictium sp.]